MPRPRLALLACLAVLAFAPFALLAEPGGATPRRSDPTSTATPLVTRFFTLVEHQDTKGLRQFLSPGFQIERADGSGANKADYLANLPTITSFSISNVTATQTGSVLVARYLATITGVVNGKAATPGPAPRISVFVRSGNTWTIVAHANFNPLTG